MKPSFDVDDRELQAALKKITLYRDDLIFIEGAGAAIQVNGQRRRVPVDTAATQNSIRSGHFTELTDQRVVDEIGPETEYAPFIEMGVKSKPNYPMQPFVRPAAVEDLPNTTRAIGRAFAEIILLQWPT